MSKVEPLTSINASYTGITKLNAHLDKIEAAFQNTVSRDGSTPNSMQADLDMNSRQLINLGDPILASHAASKAYVDEAINIATGVTLPQDLTLVYPEDYNAVGDGTTDDAVALQAALDAAASSKNGAVWIGNGKTYAFGTRLNLSSNNGFLGDGSGTLKMLTASGKFDNTDGGGGTRYGTDAVGVYATGKTKPFVKYVKFVSSPVTQGRFIRPLYFTGCTDAEVLGCDVTDFTETELLSFSSCTRPKVMFNYIHDCLYDYAAVLRQLTGIAFDNDGTASTDILVAFNIIKNLTASAAVIAAHGYETDGINIIRQTTSGIVCNNIVQNVGEGIDSFGAVDIVSNRFLDCYNFGIKGIHGMNNCLIATNNIIRPGLAGIVLNFTDSYTFHLTDVLVTGNRIYDVDPNNLWATDSSGILLAAGTTTYGLRNVTVDGNHINCVTNGEYGIKATGTNTNSSVRILDNTVVNPRTAAQTITSSFTVGRTLRELFTTTSTWTKALGAKVVRVQCWGGGGGGGGGVRVASGNAGSGGGGGGGGGYGEATFEGTTLSNTATVTVGTGGAGGAGSTSNGVAGSNGSVGTLSSFSAGGVIIRARAGGPGSGGQQAANSGGGAGGDELVEGGSASGASGGSNSAFGGGGGSGAVGSNSTGGGSGGGGCTSAAVGSNGGLTIRGGSGGGAGGGVTAAPAAQNGGNGGQTTGVYTGAAGGSGAVGTTGSQALAGFGGGGGGGGGNAAGIGYAGGNGGVGGGGGGGGGAGVGANGGAGGTGGAGYVIVTTWF